MVTQTIKVDLLNKIPSENIIFRQGEVGREIVFEVYNDGVAVDLDDYDVTFAIYKPDGNFVIVSGTVDNDTVTVEETEQMTAVNGTGFFDIKISKNNEIIYTYRGFVEIGTPVNGYEEINSISMVFGLVFPDDFQEKLTAGDNITIVDNVISASGSGFYTAGEYITIVNNVIDVKQNLLSIINGKASADDLSALANIVSGKQNALSAGTYIDIVENVIDVKSSLISAINEKADKVVFSTNETTTGDVWINNKPIYRKTISGNGNGQGSIDIDISSLQANLIMVDFAHSYVMRTDTNETMPPTYINKDSLLYSFGVIINSTNTTLTLHGASMPLGNYALTLNYTKGV